MTPLPPELLKGIEPFLAPEEHIIWWETPVMLFPVAIPMHWVFKTAIPFLFLIGALFHMFIAEIPFLIAGMFLYIASYLGFIFYLKTQLRNRTYLLTDRQAFIVTPENITAICFSEIANPVFEKIPLRYGYLKLCDSSVKESWLTLSSTIFYNIEDPEEVMQLIQTQKGCHVSA